MSWALQKPKNLSTSGAVINTTMCAEYGGQRRTRKEPVKLPKNAQTVRSNSSDSCPAETRVLQKISATTTGFEPVRPKPYDIEEKFESYPLTTLARCPQILDHLKQFVLQNIYIGIKLHFFILQGGMQDHIY